MLKNEFREMCEEGYTPKDRNNLIKDKERVQLVLQIQLIEKVRGYNPDEIHFELIPDREERRFAILRTRAKKGCVYIRGKKFYDWTEVNKEKLTMQEIAK